MFCWPPGIRLALFTLMEAGLVVLGDVPPRDGDAGALFRGLQSTRENQFSPLRVCKDSGRREIVSRRLRVDDRRTLAVQAEILSRECSSRCRQKRTRVSLELAGEAYGRREFRIRADLWRVDLDGSRVDSGTHGVVVRGIADGPHDGRRIVRGGECWRR